MPGGVVDGALIVNTKINNSDSRRGAAEFKRQVDGLRSAVNQAGRDMANGANGYIQAMNRGRAAARGATSDQAALAKEIEKTEAALKRLEERQELARRKFEASRSAAEEKAAEEFSANNAGAELLPWEDEMQAAEQLAEALNERIREVSDSFGEFEDTATFRNINVEIEVMREKLAALKAQLAQMQGQPQGGGAGEQAQGAAEKATSGWAAFGKVLGQVASGFVKVSGAALRAGAAIAKVAGGGALSFLRRLAEGARNATIQLARLSGRAVTGGFKTLGQGILAAGKWMLGLNHSAGEATNGFKRGLWAILKYGLGIRSLYFLFRKVRTAISEGLGEIAKRNPVVNAQLNAMKSALNGLKGSLASAFAPIFSAVAPALTTLINMLTAAINAVGAFMAALTGQSTYQKAVANIGAAGDAANGAGSAAGDAADAYKELKRELAGFDDLDVLGSKDSGSSGGSGGGGGGGGGGGYAYETEEIGSGITDFIGKLKEMWENADYESIGRAIAGTINNAFEKAKEWISWDNLGATITEAVNGITGIFNGLVDGIDWTLIGQTFGEGVNTIVYTCNLLLTGIDWKNLGKSIAEGLNGLVGAVNWDNLGQLFANKLNALIGVISGAVTGFKWGDAGTAFATAVNGLLGTVDWTELGKTAANSINGIVTALKNAVNGFKWGQAATNLVNAVNQLFDGVDWDALGEVASKAINKILATMKTLVSGFRWANAAENITNAINRLFDGVDWDALGEVASTAINKILATMKTLVSGFRWANAGENIVTAINRLFDGVDWDALADTASGALNGILATMKTVVSGFRWANAAENITNAINRLFDGVKWDDLSTTATTALNQILAAIKTTVSGFRWANAGETFGNTLNSLFSGTNWTELGKTAAAAIGGPLEALKNAVQTFSFGDAGTEFAGIVKGFFENEQLWADAGTVVSEALKGLFTFGKEFFDSLPTDQIAEDIRTFLGGLDWPGIVQSVWQAVLSASRAIGNVLLALLFGPDYKNKTAAKQQIEDYVSGLVAEVEGGRNFSVNFGLNLMIDNEMDAFNKLGDAINEALKTGNWVAPVGLDVPKESIEAARQEFIKEWNLLHPEAPIDPTLPDNAGQVIEDEWAAQGTSLDAEVDLIKGDPKTVEDVYNDKEKKVTGTTSLKQGDNGKQTVEDVYSEKEKRVTGTTELKQGTEETNPKGKQTVEDVYKEKEKRVTGTTELKQGTEETNPKGKQTVEDVYKEKEKRVTGTTELEKGTEETNPKGKQTVEAVYNSKDKKVSGKTQMVKGDKGKQTAESLYSAKDKAINVKAGLSKGWSGTPQKALGVDNLKTDLEVNLKKGSNDTIEITQSGGGGGGGGTWRLAVRALGGVFLNGLWHSIPQYARGTLNAMHGSMFLAGEAGPELVGHVGGRTEVLNKSQIASAMYSAVVAGMGQAVSALGTFLAGQMANCTNAIVGSIGGLAAANIRYHEPVMATGTVLPYDVAAQIAKTGADIQNTITSNTEDLIQTIISVAGQIVAAVQASGRNQQSAYSGGGLTTQQIINDINRRAQMFGGSPLLD